MTINNLLKQHPNLAYDDYAEPIFHYYDTENNRVFSIRDDHANVIPQIQTAIAIYNNLKDKYGHFHFDNYHIEQGEEEQFITITVHENAAITIDIKIEQSLQGLTRYLNGVNFQIEGYNDYLADFDPDQLIRMTHHTSINFSNPNSAYDMVQKLTKQIQQNKIYKLLSEV